MILKTTLTSVVLCLLALTVNSQNFVHPGGMHSAQDLNFVKSKLQANQQPWQSAWNQFLTTDADNYQGINPAPYASLQYQHHAYKDVKCGSYNQPNVGCNDMVYDGMAAYSLALRFYMTDDTQYAAKAIEIIDAWAVKYRSNQESNSNLVVSWAAPWYVNAAEILRYTNNSGWTTAHTNRFNTMLDRFKTYIIWENGQVNNWIMCAIEARFAVAIFQDDRPAYNAALALWKQRIKTYIYQSSDGPTPVNAPGKTTAWTERLWHDRNNRTGTIYVDGLCMETCRDISHTKLGFFALMNGAEMAWTQGDDLFQLEKERIADFMELHTPWMMGGAVPNNICDGYLDIVSEDGFEVAYSHIKDRLNRNLPKTYQMLIANRPNNAARWVKKWETLMYANRSFGPVCQPGGPNGYTNVANEGQTVTVSGTVDIAYGACGSFNYKYNQTANTPCTNAAFGDPIPGTAKKCYIKTVSQNYPQVESVTSQQTPNNASNLFDNNTGDGSRWSASGFSQSVVIDYGSIRNFKGAQVWTYQNRAYRYTVSVSNSPNSGFAQVVNRSGNTTTAQPISDNFDTVNARYVKLTVTGAGNYSGSWVSINELKMLESDYPIIASFTGEQSPNIAENVLDGNTGDTGRWSMNGFPQSLVIDYGSTRNFTGAQLFTYQNRAYQYTVSVSNTPNSGFIQVVNRSGNTSTAQPISNNFNNTSGRYVKVTVTGAGNYTGTWVSINEVKMTGTNALTKGASNIAEEAKQIRALTVYPNPSQAGIFNLSEKRNWTVYNTLGMEIKKGHSIEVNLSQYEKGVYFLKTDNETKRLIRN